MRCRSNSACAWSRVAPSRAQHENQTHHTHRPPRPSPAASQARGRRASSRARREPALERKHMPIADRLERLFRSPEGVVARTLECALWNPEAYSRGGIPRECILAADTNSEVTALSSYTDLGGRRHGCGMTCRESCCMAIMAWDYCCGRRRIAASRVHEMSAGPRRRATRPDGRSRACQSSAQMDQRRASARAWPRRRTNPRRAAETFNDARSRFLEANYSTHACAWHDWERMAQTAHAFVTAPRRDGSQRAFSMHAECVGRCALRAQSGLCELRAERRGGRLPARLQRGRGWCPRPTDG